MKPLILSLISFVFAMSAAPAGAANPTASENASATALATQGNPMTIVLDARQASRGIMYSHMTIPVTSGTFTLVYPKWIPGEHGPTGPLNDLTALRISGGGHTLTW